jgi:hypothetical protein
VNSFEKDLQRGKQVEIKVLGLIRKKYPCASLISAFKGYDIWIPEIHKAVEVKYDPMSNQTGNIVVEFEMSGRPSAIMTTTADYWIFHDDIMFVMIEPMEIIRCIFNNRLQCVEFIGNGDTQPKKAFLVPKAKLFAYGTLLEA